MTSKAFHVIDSMTSGFSCHTIDDMRGVLVIYAVTSYCCNVAIPYDTGVIVPRSPDRRHTIDAWRMAPQIQDCMALVNTLATAMLKVSSLSGGDAEERLAAMWNMFVFAILSGMVGLVAYEIFQEIGGSSKALRDHYHE